jgi:hypothetical protein
MENALKLLETVSGLLFCCIAIAVFLMDNSSLSSLLLSAKANLNNYPVLYEQYQNLEDKEEPVVEYEDLISMLMKDTSMDMVINTLELDADTYDYLQFDFANIPNASYKRSYHRDATGTVTKVIYKSI